MTFRKIGSVWLVVALALVASAADASTASNPAKKGTKEDSAVSVARPTPTSAAKNPRDLTSVWARYPAPWPSFSGDFDDIPPPDQGPDLEEPYATQWKEKRLKRQEAHKAGKPLLDPSTLCLPEGMPGVMGAIYPIQILQTPGQITVLAELFMQTRRIYMDQPLPAADEIPPSYFGFSTATWQGNALVIKTRGVKKEVEFFEIPHSEAMTITEYYQIGANGKLYLDISTEDPGYLRTPYEFRWIYERVPDYRMPEYICDNLHDEIKADGTVDLKTE